MIRHTAANPCGICGGWGAMPRGQGKRDSGFTSDDGVWVNCSRAEHAGSLPLDERTEPATYLHRIGGPCNCGEQHAPAMPAQNGPARQPSRRIVATYDYPAAGSIVLYRVARFEPKGFMPQHMTEAGAWANGFASEERILYRLPELLANPGRGVFVVEGEKDADRLASLGLIATTNPGGAASWKKHAGEYAEPFRGRPQAVVIPDNDAPGRRWATEVASSLVGVGCPVRLLELPGLPDGGDVSDWLAVAGNTVEELKRLAKDTAPWQQATRELVTSESGFTLTHIGDLLAEPDEATDWLVDDLLPMGGLGFVAAKPKAGKSTLVRNLAVAVVRGGEFLGQSCVQGTVIYLALEEKRSEVRRHFRQLGATPDDPLLVHIAKAPKDALADLLRLIRKHQPVLVIIDPLLRFTRVRDEKAYAELSNALEGVMAAAREWNCCIVATHHSPKAQGVETIDALLGSTALSGAPDTVLVIRRRDQERTVESVQRYGPDMERQLLELDGDGRLSLGVSVALAQLQAVEQRIGQLLSDGVEMTTDELARRLTVARRRWSTPWLRSWGRVT